MTNLSTRSSWRLWRLWRLFAAAALLVTGFLLLAAGRASADGSLLFNNWQPLGGVAQGSPGVTTWGSSRFDVFVRGSDNQLWHKWYTGSWSNWEDLGSPPGGLGSDPGAVAWSAGRIDVFVAGTNGNLWHKWYAGGWSGWQNLGGTIVGAPSVSSWGSGRLDVFGRGTDNRLWHMSYAGGWSTWQPLGGTLTSSPAAVSWGPGRIDVFVRGADGAAWHIFYAGGWSGYESLGGVLAFAPGVSTWGPGRLDLFVTGTNGRLYHEWVDGGYWSGYQLGLGGGPASAPVAVSPAVGQVDLFVRGTDSGIWQTVAALPPNQCSLAALRTSVVSKGAAAGSFVYQVTFTNTSASACHVYGYPGVSFLDNAGHQIGVPAARVAGFDYGPVPVVPGGSADALLQVTDVGFYSASYCQPETPASVRIFEPGATTPVYIPFSTEVCSNPAVPDASIISDVFSPSVVSL